MPYMKWSSEFELGINEFDEHHKHLMSLINMIYDGFIGEAGNEEIGAVLDELIDYATYHFAAEEYWMGVNEYPSITSHCEEHNKFANRVVEIQKDFHNGSANVSLEILQFLNSWLVNHILRTDAEYGQFAKGLPSDAA